MQGDGIGLDAGERDGGSIGDFDTEDADELRDGFPQSQPRAMEKPVGQLAFPCICRGKSEVRSGHTNQKSAQQVTADWTRNMSASVTWLNTQLTGTL